MEKIEVMVPTTHYKSNDGRIFRFENECLIYEAKNYVNKNKLFDVTINSVKRHFFFVDSKESLEKICRGFDSIEHTGGDFYNDYENGYYDKYIGQIVALGYRECEGLNDEVYFDSVDELKDTIRSCIKKLEGHISFIDLRTSEIKQN